ncbi:zinc finger protein 84-like isoform X2 [Leptidea sinapis]|nr:zinc finger protein 84-like isoform X2 [Leptidea sinapis]
MDWMIKRSMLSRSKLAKISHDEYGNTQYTCIECGELFEVKEECELHLCTHFKEFRFLCGVCGTGLKRKEHLDRHMQGHMEVRPHICEECGKAFKRKEHLNIHKSIHKGEKALQCSLCSKSFYRKDHLQKHIQTHNKHFLEQNIIPMSDQELIESQEGEVEYEDVKPIITNVFGNVIEADISAESEDYSNNGSLVDQSSDLLTDQSQDTFTDQTPELFIERPIGEAVNKERPFACATCGKCYKRKDHLKIHSWTHMKKEVVCNRCGKEFHTEDQMLVHVNLVHLKLHEMGPQQGLNQLRSLLGDQIDVEVLNDRSSLTMTRESKKSERTHECHICHRKFKRKQHLKVHANVHLKKKPTVFCSSCNEGFVSREQYESHSCQVEMILGDRDFGPHHESPTSDDIKKENFPEDLLEVVMEEACLPSPQRVFVCKFCSKPFRRKDHYKIHLHIHTGLKSFFCPNCGKGFYRKDHLHKHMLVHAKSRLKNQKEREIRPKKQIPGLLPIQAMHKKEIKPEITIHAPSNTKLRVPLQIKVPYQMVMSLDNGEQRAVTVDPSDEMILP